MKNQRISQIYNLIKEADDIGLLKSSSHLTGFSGDKFVGALQRLTTFQCSEDECYVEIGVFQGLTLLSVANALKETHCKTYGIDNFAYFDKEKKNLSIVNKRMELLEIENTKLINADYEDALENLKDYIGEQKIGVLFVDGPHDYRSQLMCLLLSEQYLSDNAIILVDDSNYRHVRQANRDFLISHPEYKLIFETYTCSHPCNMTKKEKEEHIHGWWNGLNIIIKDPENQLEPMYPPTVRSRLLYENEHSIHSSYYSTLAPRLASLLSLIRFFKPISFAENMLGLFTDLFKIPEEFKGRFPALNTYSKELPKSNFNPTLSEK